MNSFAVHLKFPELCSPRASGMVQVRQDGLDAAVALVG
jgi:hypothetical protein